MYVIILSNVTFKFAGKAECSDIAFSLHWLMFLALSHLSMKIVFICADVKSTILSKDLHKIEVIFALALFVTCNTLINTTLPKIKDTETVVQICSLILIPYASVITEYSMKIQLYFTSIFFFAFSIFLITNNAINKPMMNYFLVVTIIIMICYIIKLKNYVASVTVKSSVLKQNRFKSNILHKVN